MSNLNLNNDKNALSPLDKEFENNIRPSAIEDFSGQPQLIDNLKVFIKAAKMRGEALDHILFHGPPPAWARRPCRGSWPMSWE